MALHKAIRQSDGVTTNYHRIAFVQLATNSHCSIAVFSYVDDESRHETHTEDFQPYCRSVTYETEYDETMTVAKAYEYLKTLPQFEGATDI
jgi:hypothetical protein